VTVAAHEQHAFLWRRDGARVDLGTFGGPMGQAFAVNRHGHVVGVSSTVEGRNHAFLWQGGQIMDLGTLPGGTISHAVFINDRGQVVGVADVVGGFFRAFLWENGAMRDLGTLGGASSQATSINQAGEISGTGAISLTSGETHAALWKDGRWTDIGAQLGSGIASVDYQVNDWGQLVGMGFGFRDGFDYHPSSGRQSAVGSGRGAIGSAREGCPSLRALPRSILPNIWAHLPERNRRGTGPRPSSR
jgi:probable HAF family extracellular repeat protein